MDKHSETGDANGEPAAAHGDYPAFNQTTLFSTLTG